MSAQEAPAATEQVASVSARTSAKPNARTHQVLVGNTAFREAGKAVPMGGGAPVVVQSMLNATADDPPRIKRSLLTEESAGDKALNILVNHEQAKCQHKSHARHRNAVHHTKRRCLTGNLLHNLDDETAAIERRNG